MSHTASIMEREIKNNSSIRRCIMGDLEDLVAQVISASSAHNTSYGISYFDDGMIRAAALDASVGGRATASRAAVVLGGLGPRDGSQRRVVQEGDVPRDCRDGRGGSSPGRSATRW